MLWVWVATNDFKIAAGALRRGTIPASIGIGNLKLARGRFYGTTAFGGTAYDGGTVFKITPEGTLTTLFSFCSDNYCSDGELVETAVVQATDGIFYGTTLDGVRNVLCGGVEFDCGEVYSLSVGLHPFVKTRPTSGNVGGNVFILGNNLTGATSVTFNGTFATFTVKSNTVIDATVPTGATSGFVRVTTPRGMLKSNGKFDVTP